MIESFIHVANYYTAFVQMIVTGSGFKGQCNMKAEVKSTDLGAKFPGFKYWFYGY